MSHHLIFIVQWLKYVNKKLSDTLRNKNILFQNSYVNRKNNIFKKNCCLINIYKHLIVIYYKHESKC